MDVKLDRRQRYEESLKASGQKVYNEEEEIEFFNNFKAVKETLPKPFLPAEPKQNKIDVKEAKPKSTSEKKMVQDFQEEFKRESFEDRKFDPLIEISPYVNNFPTMMSTASIIPLSPAKVRVRFNAHEISKDVQRVAKSIAAERDALREEMKMRRLTAKEAAMGASSLNKPSTILDTHLLNIEKQSHTPLDSSLESPNVFVAESVGNSFSRPWRRTSTTTIDLKKDSIVGSARQTSQKILNEMKNNIYGKLEERTNMYFINKYSKENESGNADLKLEPPAADAKKPSFKPPSASPTKALPVKSPQKLLTPSEIMKRAKVYS
jgi:hypothetical protein